MAEAKYMGSLEGCCGLSWESKVTFAWHRIALRPQWLYEVGHEVGHADMPRYGGNCNPAAPFEKTLSTSLSFALTE